MGALSCPEAGWVSSGEGTREGPSDNGVHSSGARTLRRVWGESRNLKALAGSQRAQIFPKEWVRLQNRLILGGFCGGSRLYRGCVSPDQGLEC